MQSGISASKELHDAFNDLVSSPSQRGLLAGIKAEQLVPLDFIPSQSDDFSKDLSALASSLKDHEPAYVILRRYADAADGYVAITYVPDTAPVRQKMLFASTRLSLVRELGTERFRETLFATGKDELTAQGFKTHDQHTELKAPLTEEEQTLQQVKEAEAETSQGTSARSSHVTSKLRFPITDEALEALRRLNDGPENLVQLKIDVPKEVIELVDVSSADPGELEKSVTGDDPRYSFLRYQPDDARADSSIVFIYTCPDTSKVKERMVYASVTRSIVAMAGTNAGLTIAKRLEASSPSEITAATLHREFNPKEETRIGFSRPKRPGR
ncbi:MAG: Twinfilin-1 [Piccolia ochrophora]|nr:MAG: Twinfilin-1 [Piccolia ochrophora]